MLEGWSLNEDLKFPEQLRKSCSIQDIFPPSAYVSRQWVLASILTVDLTIEKIQLI